MLANGGLQKLQHIVALEELATGRTVLATVLRVPAAVVQLGVLLLRIRLFEKVEEEQDYGSARAECKHIFIKLHAYASNNRCML